MMNRLLLLCLFIPTIINAQYKKLFNDNWKFIKDSNTTFSNNLLDRNDQRSWTKVPLPHTAIIPLLFYGRPL
jgi:hypothetical protein